MSSCVAPGTLQDWEENSEYEPMKLQTREFLPPLTRVQTCNAFSSPIALDTGDNI